VTAHVLGLDLSLTRCGAARIHADARVQTWAREEPPVAKDAPLVDVCGRIDRQTAWAVSRATSSTALAVLERVPDAAPYGKPAERNALVLTVASALIRHGIPVALVYPNSLKKFITGNGRASKDDLTRAIAALWPATPGLARISGDEGDACGLATMGVIKLSQARRSDGWPAPWLADARSLAVDHAAQWPDLAP
jgi:crossover junction endodeoxyribonuclease RuvC